MAELTVSFAPQLTQFCEGARAGLTWHYARPPVRGLEYEMDCRAVADERVI